MFCLLYLGVVHSTFFLCMDPRKDPLRKRGFWGLEKQAGIRKCLNVIQSSGETWACPVLELLPGSSPKI